jgi:hypothetical protein
LNIDVPNRIVAPLDSLEHVANHKVRVLSSDPNSFFVREVLNPLLRFDVDFSVFKRAVLSMTLVKGVAPGNRGCLQVW